MTDNRDRDGSGLFHVEFKFDRFLTRGHRWGRVGRGAEPAENRAAAWLIVSPFWHAQLNPNQTGFADENFPAKVIDEAAEFGRRHPFRNGGRELMDDVEGIVEHGHESAGMRRLDFRRGRFPAHRGGRFPEIDTEAEDSTDRVNEFVSTLRPFIGVLGKDSLNHRFESRRIVIEADFGKWRRRLAEMGIEEPFDVVRVEGQPAREHFVQDYADRIEIAAVIDRVAPDHFRADIGRRPHRVDGPLASQFGEMDMWLGGETREAEIHHLDGFVVRAGSLNHQVGRLEIAMDDAGRVSGLQRMAEIADQPPGPFRFERPGPAAAPLPA